MSKIRGRHGSKVFEEFFHRVVDLCLKAGLVKGEQITDSILIEANASSDSIVNKETDVTDSQSTCDGTTQYVKKFSNQTHSSKTDPENLLAN